MAQGGVFCGRNYRNRIRSEAREGLSRYGDERTPKPIGIQTIEVRHTADKTSVELIDWFVPSNRHTWEAIQAPKGSRYDTERAKPAQPLNGNFELGLEESSPPWTSVNNCTDKHEDEKFDDTFQQVSVQNAGTSFDPEQIITLPQYRSGHT